jgi:hypothetical protein
MEIPKSETTGLLMFVCKCGVRLTYVDQAVVVTFRLTTTNGRISAFTRRMGRFLFRILGTYTDGKVSGLWSRLCG